MSEQWQRAEGALNEAMRNIFNGLASFLRLCQIYQELPPDDQTLLIQTLFDRNYDKEMRPLDELIEQAGEAGLELMKEIRRVIEERRMWR